MVNITKGKKFVVAMPMYKYFGFNIKSFAIFIVLQKWLNGYHEKSIIPNIAKHIGN